MIQNQTIVANGFVSMAPRRTEFFTTPPQKTSLLGTYNWLDLLAVHEYRHVAQFSRANVGLTKTLSSVFGSFTLSGISNLAPNWFYEGDAVCSETFMSNSGRGRNPDFDMAFRARLLSDGGFGYSKAACGSLKDFVPNHYVLGYLMSSELKKEKGEMVWNNVLQDFFKNPLIPFGFSRAIKKQTGLSVDNYYKKALENLVKTWQKQADSTKNENYQEIIKTKQTNFTSYQYPQYQADGSIIAIKTGFSVLDQIVEIKEGKEKTLFELGNWNDSGSFSANNGKAVWVEYAFDPRWGMRDYSVIKVLDISTQKLTQITNKSRFFAPALSNDASKIVVVEHSENGQNSLKILDTKSGDLIQALPNPQIETYVQPKWINDNTVGVITVNNFGKKIQSIDLQTLEKKIILDVKNINIAGLCFFENLVFYNSPESGIDQVYCYDIVSKNKYQISADKFGAFNGAIDKTKNKIAFNYFRNQGFKLTEIAFDLSKLKPLNEREFKPEAYFGRIGSRTESSNILTDLSSDTLASKKYSKLNLINFYGWNPLITSTLQDIKFGFLSKDILSTTTIDANIGYNSAEQMTSFGTNISYQGLYPVIDLGFQSLGRRTTIALDNALPIDSIRTSKWQQNSLNLKFSLPFNFTNSKYSNKLLLSTGLSYITSTGYNLPRRPISEASDGSFLGLNFSVSYAYLLKMRKLDLQPRLGYSFFVNSKSSPFNSNLKVQQFSVGLTGFLPGIAQHHGLRWRLGYQSDDEKNYRLSLATFYPRGLGYGFFKDFLVNQLDYKFPILLPDLALGRFLYLQRVKGVFFTDFINARESRNQSSVFDPKAFKTSTLGFDLLFDFNVMRFAPRFEVGVRTIYVSATNKFIFQPLVIDIGF